MLDVASPPATAVALLLLTLAIRPSAPAPQWIGGWVLPGSIETTDDGGGFILVEGWGGGDLETIEVEFTGELPATICDRRGVRADVALSGRFRGATFEAATVAGYNNGKYDPCWEQRCVPWDQRPPACQPWGFE
jgi:hypothetical protein